MLVDERLMEEGRWSRVSRWVRGLSMQGDRELLYTLFAQRRTVFYVKGKLLDAWA